jgi:hypothetical protein
MIRRDAAQDNDRPHYYSQYWINVALGKPTGMAAEAPTAVLGGADVEAEPAYEPPAPAPRPEPVKTVKQPKVTERKQEPARLSSLADLANIEELMKSSAAMEDDVVPDIETSAAGTATEPPIVINANLDELSGEAEAEDFDEFEDTEDFDEEEEEDEWGGRRPGRGGPTRPTKPPKRPERRRDF